MDSGVLRQRMDEVFDQAIVYHGFTDYMRDYEVVFFCTADPSTGIASEHVRYVFRHCVLADVETAVTPAIWRASTSDRNLEWPEDDDVTGFVWGVRWQPFYPGPDLVTDSSAAQEWSQRVGIPFHEVVLQANAHSIRLVFSDLEVLPAPRGYRPFEVKD